MHELNPCFQSEMDKAMQVSQRLAMLDESDDVLGEAVRLISDAFGFSSARIYLVEEASESRPQAVLQAANTPATADLPTRGERLEIDRDATIGRVVRTAQSVLTTERSYSRIAVPLCRGSRVVGVLDVQSDRADEGHQYRLRLLQLLSSQIVIAAGNAGLSRNTAHRLEAMSALHAVSLDIVAELDLPELLNTLLQRAMRLTNAAAADLYGYDSSNDRIHNIANLNTARDWRGVTLRPGEGVIGYVVQTGKPLIIDDYASWPGRLAPFSESGHTVVMGVPLKWRSQIIGGLAVLNEPGGHHFTQEDLWVLTAFADLASIALKNAELFAETKSFGERLESEVKRRTSELILARKEIAEKGDELQGLLSRIIHVQEEERARIARDLHDGVMQLIIGALFELQSARGELATRLQSTAETRLDEVRSLLVEIDKELRRAIYNLGPALVDSSGIVSAVRKYTAIFQEMAGIPCGFERKGTPKSLAAASEIAVFRIVQEALHNVMKHARAKTARVRLEFRPTHLIVIIEDNGQGFDVQRTSAHPGAFHYGVINIAERARAIGGEVRITSRIGAGTKVSVKVPLSRREIPPKEVPCGADPRADR